MCGQVISLVCELSLCITVHEHNTRQSCLLSVSIGGVSFALLYVITSVEEGGLGVGSVLLSPFEGEAEPPSLFFVILKEHGYLFT